MWIFNTDGFFSVVQHNSKPDIVQVRARVRTDLESLKAAIDNEDDKDLGLQPLDCDDIVEMRDADYRFRMDVDRLAFAEYMLESVMHVDYTTDVKGNLAGGDKRRKDAMMNVWHAMHRLQDDEAQHSLSDDDFFDLLDQDDDDETDNSKELSRG